MSRGIAALVLAPAAWLLWRRSSAGHAGPVSLTSQAKADGLTLRNVNQRRPVA